MPMHLFQCEACAQEFEALVSHRDPFPACTTCGAPTRRLINGTPAYSLKGSGWALDGYSGVAIAERSRSDKADRAGKIVSFPGQKNKGREGI